MLFTNHELLETAERRVRQKRKRLIDWSEFFGPHGRYLRHYLTLGTSKNCFDWCHRVSLIDESEAPYPSQMLARPYLRELIWAQGMENQIIFPEEFATRQPPLYFRREAKGDLCVVDISAAYWQLYRPLTYDLHYDGKTPPRQGKVRFLGVDQLRPHKRLRNAIVGSARADRRIDVDMGAMKTVQIANKYLQLGLWSYLMDLLEMIAWDMRSRFGAVHIHTDGYVLPHADLAEDAVAFLADRWGLHASIRARGEGQVRGLGVWTVGLTKKGPKAIPDDPYQGAARVLESFPNVDMGEPVDNMSEEGHSDDLRRWWLDADAYRRENPKISPKRLDGRLVDW